MGYKRADDILPEHVLRDLQRYVSGETIYVPKENGNRKKWGSGTDVNEKLRLRNGHILEQHLKGATVKELAQSYSLTEKSIQRILRNTQAKPPMERSAGQPWRDKIE